MVLGMWDGKITITTEKDSYSPGELLRGKVTLVLETPKKARALRIKFYGEKEEYGSRTKYGRRRTVRKTERIHEQEFVLDGEKEYPAGQREYTFQFQLPNIPKPPKPSQDGGLLGMIGNAIAAASDPYAHVTWYLDASLDLPLSFDVNKKQVVNLVR